jgi:hypothetical protein
MRHDWIFDVLTDLRNYAQANGLTALAEQAEVALRVARAEIGTPDRAGGEGGPDGPGPGGAPPRAH